MPRRLRKLSRPVLLLLALMLLVGALLDNATGFVTEAWRWPARMVLLLAAAAVFRATVRRRPRQPDEKLRAPDGCGPSSGDLHESANLVLDLYGEGPILAFTRMLVEGAHVSRVAENVQLIGDLLAIDVTIEVALDGLLEESAPPAGEHPVPRAGKLVIPIVRRKELKLESFEARDSADTRLSHLPQRMTDGWLAWAVKNLYELAYVEGEAQPTRTQRQRLYRLVQLICRSDLITPEDFRRRYDEIIGAAATPRRPEAELLREVCEYFAGSTVSAIEVAAEAPGPLTVRYSYLTTADRLRTRNNRMRTRLGIRPYRYYIPMSWAYYADLYDLRITGPASHFVYRHYLSQLTEDGEVVVEPEDLRPRDSGTGVRLDRNAGAPFAGVHTRGIGRVTGTDTLQCVVEFEEIPPGALRRALVISAVCTLIITAFTVAIPAAVQDNRGTDMAALLLAAPGLAATFVGLTTDRVQQSSLTTFGGLLVSAGLSFMASVLYLFQSLIWRDPPRAQISILELLTMPETDITWLSVAALSMFTTFHLALEDAYRTRRYTATLRGRSAPKRHPTRRN